MNEEQLESMMTQFAIKTFRKKRKELMHIGANWIDEAAKETAKYMVKLLVEMLDQAEAEEKAKEQKAAGY